MARPEGYVRAFVDAGARMAALLQSLIRARRGSGSAISREEREHVNRVVQAFRRSRGMPEATPSATGSIELLTRREREVLESMAAGKHNRQIADELVITLDTVKRHVSHIFDKLGTANRTEAVVRARQLHLIP